MSHKHPDVIEKSNKIDLSDLLEDPIVRFQRRFYYPLVILCWALLPMSIPIFAWGETPTNAFLLCVLLRYAHVLNLTFLVNSMAHKYGMRPYNGGILPTENKLVTYCTLGEGECREVTRS